MMCASSGETQVMNSAVMMLKPMMSGPRSMRIVSPMGARSCGRLMCDDICCDTLWSGRSGDLGKLEVIGEPGSEEL